MIFQVELHPLAQQELNESRNWYEERLVGLGVRFVNAVDRRLYQISQNPEKYARKKDNYREVIVYGFPFLIIYEIFAKQKIVFVSYIFHTKRNPKLKYKR